MQSSCAINLICSSVYRLLKVVRAEGAAHFGEACDYKETLSLQTLLRTEFSNEKLSHSKSFGVLWTVRCVERIAVAAKAIRCANGSSRLITRKETKTGRASVWRIQFFEFRFWRQKRLIWTFSLWQEASTNDVETLRFPWIWWVLLFEFGSNDLKVPNAVRLVLWSSKLWNAISLKAFSKLRHIQRCTITWLTGACYHMLWSRTHLFAQAIRSYAPSNSASLSACSKSN